MKPPPRSSASAPGRSAPLGALAAALFAPLFIRRGIGPLDFWWWMSANLAVLIALAAAGDPGFRASLRRDISRGAGKKALLGLLSAAVLYGVFFAGNFLVRRVWPGAGANIAGVYGFKSGASALRVGLTLLLVIGPGEELFWRAFLQRAWQERFGPAAGGLAAAALYALVHAGSANPLLVLAAAVCGLFWGALYWKTGSALLVAVSHTAWDLAVFLIFPFR